jgi:hypothetical protein
LKTVSIRSQPLLAMDAINRQPAHYSYHVGQIVYVGKWLKGDDWQSLSIPRGDSAAYNKAMEKRFDTTVNLTSNNVCK